MTKLPHDNRDVKPLKGDLYPHYKVKPICAHPDCSRYADHAHHLWRRSFMGGDYAWVKLWDDTVVGNLVGLCWRHHEEITENKAEITWVVDRFYWGSVVGSGNTANSGLQISGPISPQPPRWGKVEHVHKDAELCPACNRPKRPPREELPPGQKRRRKTWSVSVPDDEEDGASVLDVLIEEVAAQFGVDHYTSALKRYHVLVPALAYLVQNKVTIEGSENG